MLYSTICFFSLFPEPVLQLGAESSAVQAAAHGGRTGQVSFLLFLLEGTYEIYILLLQVHL
jgi:hypothetical protein